MAYGLSEGLQVAKIVLVYDLGGGTFNVSILNIYGNVCELKATDGNRNLGGNDFDHSLMQSFAAEFKRKSKVDINGNERALLRLRSKCERAKQILSTARLTTVLVDSLCDGIDFVFELSRPQLNEWCGHLFVSTICLVKNVLRKANSTCGDIDKIVLVGGSTIGQ